MTQLARVAAAVVGSQHSAADLQRNETLLTSVTDVRLVPLFLQGPRRPPLLQIRG